CEFDQSIIHYNDSSFNELEFAKSWEKLDIPQLVPGGMRIGYSAYREPLKSFFTLIPDPDTPYVLVKVFEKGPGNDSFVVERIERTTPAQVRKFSKTLDTHCFWTTKVDDEERLGGAGWFLEAKRIEESPCSLNDHHFVWRYTSDTLFKKIFIDGFSDMMHNK
ncbi:MAG: hypothetical protein AB8F95_02065, partial [Bacteroidia bacterium]